MEDKLNRIENKIDKIDERLCNIDVTLGKQSVVLEDHTRRSLANEKAVEYLKEELKPILKHVTIVNFLGRSLGIVLCSDLVYNLIKWLLAK
jgi:archaellum component FlaC